MVIMRIGKPPNVYPCITLLVGFLTFFFPLP